MCTFVFTAALFIIAKIWKQPKYPSIDEWIKKVWDTFIHTHSTVLPNHNFLKKEKSCNNTDKSKGYHAKWIKSEKEKYHIISLICRI